MQKTPHRYRLRHFKCDEFHQHLLVLRFQLAVSNAGELPADHAGLLQGEPRAEGEHLPEQGAAQTEGNRKDAAVHIHLIIPRHVTR